jgi:hypothetical protein
MIEAMLLALKRARFAILSVGLTYLLAVIAGRVMVHSGNHYSLHFRDRLVGQATHGNIIHALDRGSRTKAALLDFGGNLLFGAVPQTVSGLAIIPPYGFAMFRGWVGGIVSVDGNHHSRLADPHERTYYLVVLILQLIPYSLTGGAGVHPGLAWFREWQRSGWARQWRLPMPRSALADAFWLYALAVPLFLGASLFEFLAR